MKSKIHDSRKVLAWLPAGVDLRFGGDVLKSVTGYNFTPDLMQIGERIYTLERLILNREGIRSKDDFLPERVSRAPIPSGPAKGHVLSHDMYEVMLNEYYESRGWDSDGVPKEETVRGLSLATLLS